MKIVIVGANGTVGRHVVQEFVSKHEVVKVGKKTGDFHVDLENPESITRLFKEVGNFDALVCTAGEVAFAPFSNLTSDHWKTSFQSKLSGQIQLVHQAIPHIHAGGSFTLISGILSEEYIKAGVIATTVNRAIEGFVQATACELPQGLRINVVSPTLLKDSVDNYGDFFPGFAPVDGKKVAEAFKKAVLGVETGRIYKVI